MKLVSPAVEGIAGLLCEYQSYFKTFTNVTTVGSGDNTHGFYATMDRNPL